MTRRAPLLGVMVRGPLVMTLALIASGAHGAAQIREPLFVARPLDLRLERLQLEHVDLTMRMAIRSAHTATIRRLSFAEATLDGMPIRVDPVEARWHVVAARESILPRALQARLYTRDVMQELDLRTLAARGSVRVRATAEIDVEMPWLARLLLPGSTRTLMLDTEVDVPLYAEGGVVAAAARVAATVLDAGRPVSRNALAAFLSVLGPRPGGVTAAEEDLLRRYRDTTAEISITYALESRAGRTPTTVRGLGFWAAPSVLCTTREVLEPWRFDPRAAAAVRYGQSRLVVDHGPVVVGGTRSSPARIDIRHSGLRLPEPAQRSVYVWLDGKPREIALARREHRSNVICLGLDGKNVSTSPGFAAQTAQGPLSAFAMKGGTFSVVPARATAAEGRLLRLDPPLTRSAYGSPIVSPTGISGMVLSATTAATIDDVRRAMALIGS